MSLTQLCLYYLHMIDLINNLFYRGGLFRKSSSRNACYCKKIINLYMMWSFYNNINCCESGWVVYSRTISSSTSILINSTSVYFAANSWITVSICLQGPHHVAVKSITIFSKEKNISWKSKKVVNNDSELGF